PCPPWLETPCSPWAQRAQARHCLELQGFRPLAAGDLDRGAEAVPGFRRIARGEELTANAVQLRLPPTFTGRAGVLERRRNRCQALLVAFFPPACLREKTPIVRKPESCRGPQHVDAAPRLVDRRRVAISRGEAPAAQHASPGQVVGKAVGLGVRDGYRGEPIDLVD